MKKSFVKAGMFVSGALIGGAVTFHIFESRVRKKYIAIAEEEIESVKETYKLLNKEGAYSDPREALKEYNRRLDELDQYKAMSESEGYSEDEDESFVNYDKIPSEGVTEVVEEKVEIIEEEIEVQPPPHKDGEPHVISYDEFMEDRDDHDKITITYYEDDDTLVDEDESIIPDIMKTIGYKSTDFFGYHSHNPDMVYVRNEFMGTDFEVIRDRRSYTEAVLGYKTEIVEKRKPRKMRDDE